MRDIVLYHIPHEQGGEVDTDDGIDEVEPVVGVGLKLTRQQCHYLIDEPMQHGSSHRSQYAHHERQDEQKHLVAHMCYPPLVQG